MPFEIKMTEDQVVDGLRSAYGTEFTAADIKGFCSMNDITYQTVTKKLKKYKVAKGRWNLEVTTKAVENIEKSFNAPSVVPSEIQNLVPEKDNTFIPFGSFKDVKKIIQSSVFYPAFITGLSGNGKTFSVEQACAQLGRELIRVNITIETDEDDLIGGFRLVDGSTVWPLRRRNPPMRSSSSVSIVIFTRISSLLRDAQACSTENVLPFPERPVIKVG